MRVTRILLLACLVAGLPVLRAQGEPAKVFAEANDLFRRANQVQATAPQQASELYRKAVLRYRHLIDEVGIRNSKLFYNLANTYHQLDDIGRAIVNYRRAERLDPADPNLLRNLEHARSRRQDKLDSDTGGQALKTLLFWHYEFSVSSRVRLFACAWLLFWTLLLMRLLGQVWVPREIAMGSGVVAALFLGSLAHDAVTRRSTVEGVIVSPDTIARQGDGQSYEPAFRDPLHAGAEFEVLETRPDWYRVELPDGRSCWLAERDVELVR